MGGMTQNNLELKEFLKNKNANVGPQINHPLNSNLIEMKRNLQTLMFNSDFSERIN